MVKILISGASLLLLASFGPWLLPRASLDGTIPEQPYADSRFGEVEGVRLHWRERLVDAPAERPLVVLVHGFGGSTFTWRHALDALEQAGYPAVAVDLPPFGYSERTGRGADWETLVLGLAERVAPTRGLVVVGHSMGAAVAAGVGAAAPGRVRMLAFVDGTPNARAARIPFGWALAIPAVRRVVDSWASWKLVEEDNIREMLTSAFGREPTDDEFEGYYHPLTIPDSYPALLVRLHTREAGAPDGWDRVPLAVLWGAQDDWVEVGRIRPFIEDHPELVTFDTIEDAAHNPMDTHPEAFNEWLLRQLGSLE